MKRISRILSIAAVIMLLASSMSFAAGLNLVKSYPEDGAGGFEPINMMVKLYFDGAVGAESAQPTNEKAFKVVDAEGKAVEFKVLFTPEDETRVSLLMSKDLAADTEYKVTILKTLQTGEGVQLGADKTFTFNTRDVKKDSFMSTVMMMVMIGGMVAYTMWDTKRKLEKESMAKGDKVNPYKVAKEKGVTVQEAVEKTEKQRSKAIKKTGSGAMNIKKGSEIKKSGAPKKK